METDSLASIIAVVVYIIIRDLEQQSKTRVSCVCVYALVHKTRKVESDVLIANYSRPDHLHSEKN